MITGNKLIAKSKTLGVSLLLLALTGCSTYGSSFGCGDAPGAKCMPMDKVDRLISSGEIERFTKNEECKRGRCKKSKVTKEEELPALRKDLSEFNIEFSRSNNW